MKNMFSLCSWLSLASSVKHWVMPHLQRCPSHPIGTLSCCNLVQLAVIRNQKDRQRVVQSPSNWDSWLSCHNASNWSCALDTRPTGYPFGQLVSAHSYYLWVWVSKPAGPSAPCHTMFDLPFPIMVYRLLAGAYSMPVLSLSGVLKESNLLKHPMQFLGVSIRPIKPLEWLKDSQHKMKLWQGVAQNAAYENVSLTKPPETAVLLLHIPFCSHSSFISIFEFYFSYHA